LIRVTLPEVTAPQMPAQNLPSTEDFPFSPPGRNPQAIDWSHGLPAIVLGGVVSAALMIFPLGAFGLGMLAAGGLAAFFYHHRAPGSDITSGIGGKLGALSGLVGFGIFTVFAAVVTLLSGTERLRATLLEAVNQSASRTADPNALQAFEYFKTPAGLAIILILGLFFLLVMFLIFSTVGGVLGAAWIRRRRRF